jgi:hypothetical protein
MTQWASLIPILLFAALFGTVVMAPIYYLTANKLGGAGQITVALVVAVVLGGAILAAATNRTPGETADFSETIVVILTPLAIGWIISAFISLLISALDRQPVSRPETGSDQLPRAHAEGGEPSSRPGAALDHEAIPLVPTLQPAAPPSLPPRDAKQAQPVD